SCRTACKRLIKEKWERFFTGLFNQNLRVSYELDSRNLPSVPRSHGVAVSSKQPIDRRFVLRCFAGRLRSSDSFFDRTTGAWKLEVAHHSVALRCANASAGTVLLKRRSHVTLNRSNSDVVVARSFCQAVALAHRPEGFERAVTSSGIDRRKLSRN